MSNHPQVTRSNLYLGTAGMVLAGIDGVSTEQLEAAEQQIGLIVPLGFLVIPLIDDTIGRVGIITTLHITSLLGLLYNGLQLLPFIPAQLAAAAVFAAFRAFLFSVISSFNMLTFGPKTMGRVMGLCFIAAAFVNLAQARDPIPKSHTLIPTLLVSRTPSTKPPTLSLFRIPTPTRQPNSTNSTP